MLHAAYFGSYKCNPHLVIIKFARNLERSNGHTQKCVLLSTSTRKMNGGICFLFLSMERFYFLSYNSCKFSIQPWRQRKSTNLSSSLSYGNFDRYHRYLAILMIIIANWNCTNRMWYTESAVNAQLVSRVPMIFSHYVALTHPKSFSVNYFFNILIRKVQGKAKMDLWI